MALVTIRAAFRIRLPPPWRLTAKRWFSRVGDARFGEPLVGERRDPSRGHTVLLTTSPERAPAEFDDMVTKTPSAGPLVGAPWYRNKPATTCLSHSTVARP